MKISISQDAKLTYPDLKVSILEVRSSQKLQFNENLIEMKRQLENKISEWENPELLDHVTKYNSFYKKFSSKVPMEFQIKSVASGKGIPAFNPILAGMFMAELKNIILTAGHDLDTLGDHIQVQLSEGSEEYTKINGKLQQLKKDDIFATDGNSIISSVLYGPDMRTRITDESNNYLFMCYVPFDISDDELRNHMDDIANYLKVVGNNTLEVGEVKIAK